MEDLFGREELSIEARTPVHVGTDERLREDLFVKEGMSILVLDERKLFDWAASAPEHSDDLVRFFSERTGEIPNITAFLRGKRPPAKTFTAYRLPLLQKDANAKGPKEIIPFIKAPGHRPYLPGSSIKGAVRSAILRGAYPHAAAAVQAEIRSLARRGGKHASEEVQAQLLVGAQVKGGRYPNYDLLRALGFADTAPVSPDKLQVCEVQILSSRLAGRDGERALGQKERVSLHVEALKPGTRLRGSLMWQRGLLSAHGPAADLRLAGLRDRVIGFCKLCREAAEALIAQELRFYEGHRGDAAAGLARRYSELLNESRGLHDRAFLWPLGFGTGYDAKTLTDLLGDEAFDAVAHGSKHTRRLGRPSEEPENWLGPDLSPKSRKVVFDRSGRPEPMGWLRVEIQGGS